MPYIDELKARRSKLAREMADLMSDGHSLNNRERQHFNDIDQDLKDLDITISRTQALDNRGDMPGKARDTRDTRKYKQDKQVQGPDRRGPEFPAVNAPVG